MAGEWEMDRLQACMKIINRDNQQAELPRFTVIIYAAHRKLT